MQIVNVGQVFDLVRGGMVNQLTIQLRDGKLVTIQTNEETITQLLNAAAQELRSQVEKNGQDEGPDIGEVAQADPEQVSAPSTFEFSEDVDTSHQSDTEPEVKATQKPAVDSNAVKRRSVPSRTVPKDEAGYPIVPKTIVVPDDKWDDEDGTSI